jgi:hypothetical protein
MRLRWLAVAAGAALLLYGLFVAARDVQELRDSACAELCRAWEPLFFVTAFAVVALGATGLAAAGGGSAALGAAVGSVAGAVAYTAIAWPLLERLLPGMDARLGADVWMGRLAEYVVILAAAVVGALLARRMRGGAVRAAPAEG